MKTKDFKKQLIAAYNEPVSEEIIKAIKEVLKKIEEDTKALEVSQELLNKTYNL